MLLRGLVHFILLIRFVPKTTPYMYGIDDFDFAHPSRGEVSLLDLDGVYNYFENLWLQFRLALFFKPNDNRMPTYNI